MQIWDYGRIVNYKYALYPINSKIRTIFVNITPYGNF